MTAAQNGPCQAGPCQAGPCTDAAPRPCHAGTTRRSYDPCAAIILTLRKPRETVHPRRRSSRFSCSDAPPISSISSVLEKPRRREKDDHHVEPDVPLVDILDVVT